MAAWDFNSLEVTQIAHFNYRVLGTATSQGFEVKTLFRLKLI